MKRPDWWYEAATVITQVDHKTGHEEKRVREVQEIAADLHMINSGGSDDWKNGEIERKLLEWCVNNWEPSTPQNQAFDDAILNLVKVALTEVHWRDRIRAKIAAAPVGGKTVEGELSWL